MIAFGNLGHVRTRWGDDSMGGGEGARLNELGSGPAAEGANGLCGDARVVPFEGAQSWGGVWELISRVMPDWRERQRLNEEHRAEALVQLAAQLSGETALAQASQIAERIKHKGRRTRVLGKLARQLSGKATLAQASQIAGQIEDEEQQAEARQSILIQPVHTKLSHPCGGELTHPWYFPSFKNTESIPNFGIRADS